LLTLGGLQINTRYARKFDEINKRKDLQRAKELGLDDESDGSIDSEDAESEDDDAELLTTSLDLQIVKTINSIRKKDPKIYEKNNVWFEGAEDEDEDEEDEDDEDDRGKDDESGKKPKRYKDVLREQLLSKGADIEDSDAHGQRNNETKKKNKLIYDHEQEKMRKEFLQTIADNDSDAASSDEMTLQVKKKSNAELLREQEELQKVLDEMTKLGKKSKAKSSNEEPSADEFLSDYILKQKWKSGYSLKERDDDADNPDEDAVDFDEDEEELDKMENFESKYNFRFEELQDSGDANAVGGLKDIQVVGHARNVQGSVRKEDEKRKQERERRKERKDREKRVKEAEIKRLKNLKRQELMSRLEKIGQIGGINENIGIDIDELDEEWDPVKHEQMMQKQFGSEYYNETDNIEPNEEEERILQEIENDQENYGGIEEPEDDGVGTVAALLKAKKRNEKRNKKGRKQSSEYVEEEDFEYDEATQEKIDKLNEELYKLDYEDIVGGVPCRFKYRQVEAQDYGLSAEDILNAEDNELNQFLSLKKLSPYNFSAVREEKLSKKRKRLRSAIKERISTVVAGSNSNETIDTVSRDSHQLPASNEEAKKKRKRRKKSTDDGADTKPSPLTVDRPVPLAVIKHNKITEKNSKKKKEGKKKEGGKSNGEKDKARRLGLYK
jgi:protein KRI1